MRQETRWAVVFAASQNDFYAFRLLLPVDEKLTFSFLSGTRTSETTAASAISKTFVGHLGRLREQIRNTIERQPNLRLDSNRENGNAVTVLKVSFSTNQS